MERFRAAATSRRRPFELSCGVSKSKGYLTHEEEGRAYVYRAAQPARSVAAHAVRQIIDRFCRGSVEELVSGMVDAKVLSKSEMKRLEEFVRSRKGKK